MIRNTMTMPRALAAGVLAAALAGCSFTPEYQQPISPVPADIGRAADSEAPEVAIPEGYTPAGWRHVFVDPQLQQLISAALEQNRDLREAVLNVEAARVQYRIQRSALLPDVGIMAESARQRVPADLSAT